MRLIIVRATSIAALLLASAAARAEPDAFYAEATQIDPPKAVAVTKPVIDSDRTPTSSVPPRATIAGPTETVIPQAPVASPHVASETPATAKPKAADKGVDPEGDEVIKPPTASPSQDPLDALPPSPAASIPPAKPARDDASRPTGTSAAAPDGPKQVAQLLPPIDAAIKLALDKKDASDIRGASAAERRKERAAVAFLYAAHGFAPIWSDKGAPSAAVGPVLDRLAHAGDDALTLSDVPKTVATSGTPDVIAAGDIALTEAVVAYARQASGSRVDPMSISPLIGAKRALADPAEIVDAVIAAGSAAGETLRAVNPADPRYTALRDKLVEIRAASRDVPATRPSARIPAGPSLRVGMRDKRVPLLRARFGLGATIDMATEDTVYDSEVAEAVAAFQRDNGLSPNGVLTKRTVEALSGDRTARPSKMEGMLVANMEMWRWMPRDLGHDRIEVNVPDFLVTVFHDDTPVSTNRVVVGKIDTPTPLFSNTMKYLIVNPYWNVPQSIVKNEMLPKGHGSLSYLDGHGYSVSWHDGQAVVKQLPGDKNALGRIKFLFPNDYSVYLHDTPSKSLFSAEKRAFSHGCVRVDKPFAFAESVLKDGDAGARRTWSQERLKDMIGDKERYVNLPAPLPIHIEYFTASMNGGEVKLRDDVYGYANAVAGALGQDSSPMLVAGRTKPKPAVEARRQPTGLEKTATAAPVPASRGFWEIFDPR